MKTKVEIKGRVGDHITVPIKEALKILRKREAQKVVLEFNGVELVISDGMKVEDVVGDYHRIGEERHLAYLKSPEYKKQKREDEEKEARRVKERNEWLSNAPPNMTLIDLEGWAKCKEVNSKDESGYSMAVLNYAELWARLMEGRILAGKKLEEIAERASGLADDEGVTGFMYGAAANILSQVWIHGEPLRKWHNSQYGASGAKANESGGTINPAILTIRG